MSVRIREKIKGSGVYNTFINFKCRRRAIKAGEYQTAKALQERLETQLLLDANAVFKKPEVKRPAKKKKVPTFKTVATDFVTQNEDDWRSSTYQKNVGILDNYAFPAIVSMPVDAITKGDVKALIARVKKVGRSMSLQLSVKSVVHSVLQVALDNEKVEVNKAAGIGNRKKKSADVIQREREMAPDRVFTSEQMKALLNAATTAAPVYKAMFQFLVQTGVRHGEALGLHWDAMDLEVGRVLIKKSLRHHERTRKKPVGSARLICYLIPSVCCGPTGVNQGTRNGRRMEGTCDGFRF